MVHLWQHHHGKNKSRTTYHNKEWAAMMESIGLMPTATDGSGKKTGNSMTHEIIPGDMFDQVTDELLAKGIKIQYADAHGEEMIVVKAPGGAGVTTIGVDPVAIVKRASKTRFSCSKCGANAWGKPDLQLTCTPCNKKMKP
jgi:hypothetical protein